MSAVRCTRGCREEILQREPSLRTSAVSSSVSPVVPRGRDGPARDDDPPVRRQQTAHALSQRGRTMRVAHEWVAVACDVRVPNAPRLTAPREKTTCAKELLKCGATAWPQLRVSTRPNDTDGRRSSHHRGAADGRPTEKGRVVELHDRATPRQVERHLAEERGGAHDCSPEEALLRPRLRSASHDHRSFAHRKLPSLVSGW